MKAPAEAPVKARSVLTGGMGLALAAAAGGAMGLGQSPVGWPFVLFLALPLLFRLLAASPGPRAGFGLGWCAGTGYFAATLFWIVEPFLVDAPRHGWMAPFALAGMAAGLALFWAVPFALTRALWPRAGLARVLMLASAWTLAEAARAHVLTGFPWALVAYAWIETPVMQAAALVGPHGLGFLTLVAGLLPGLATVPAAVAAALLVAAAWGWGSHRLAAPMPPRAEPLMVRLVQPNAAQTDKWDPAREAEIFARLRALSQSPAAVPPDVTIWPETAVPFLLDDDPAAQAAAAAAAGPEGRLILGIRRAEPGEMVWTWFNSLAVLAPDGTALAVYDKARLVPFGEYIPLSRLMARLGSTRLASLTGGGFTPGPGPAVLAVPGLPPFRPLICYEAIFPGAMHGLSPRPDWLVQITNDAWFGQVSGPFQHLAQARSRAIEQGLPLARAANTGISAMMDARGEIVARLDLSETGVVDAVLPPALPPTPYARIGDLHFFLGFVLIFGLTLLNFGGGVFKVRRG